MYIVHIIIEFNRCYPRCTLCCSGILYDAPPERFCFRPRFGEETKIKGFHLPRPNICPPINDLNNSMVIKTARPTLVLTA